MSSCIHVLDNTGTNVRDLITYLAANGFATECSTVPEEALVRIATSGPGLVLLGHLSPPSNCALQALLQIRAFSPVPCIVLSERSDDHAGRVLALEAGADDVLPSTMPQREVLARIRAVLRRTLPQASGMQALTLRPPPLGSGKWVIMPERRRLVAPDGTSHRLTAAEFEVLRMLICAEGDTVSRDAICRAVLGRRWEPDDRAVDNLVARLRRKLEPDAFTSARGIGYVFVGFSEGPSIEVLAEAFHRRERVAEPGSQHSAKPI